MDPLSALRDIHTPPVPDGLSVWPIIAGVAAFVLLLVLLGMILLRTRRRWASDLKHCLEAIDTTQPDEALTEAAKLLRRAALKHNGADMARLQGEVWLAALDGLFRTRFFTEGSGRLFGGELYAPALDRAPAMDVMAELKRLAARREWLPW